MKFNEEVNVVVKDRIELQTLHTFFREVTDGKLKVFAFPDSGRFPIMAYCRGESSFAWGWDSVREVKHKTGVSIEEFMMKYGPPYKLAYNVETINEEKQWTAAHYDVNYTLTEQEIKQGFVRLDTYKVNKAWGINSVDATGCGFHILKTVNRIPRGKNPLERELRAIIGQAKCWANEEGIDLSDLFK